MSLRTRLLFNTRWHRRIGLFCAFFVLVLSITGVLLNHTSSLKLDSVKLQSALISTLYNLPDSQPVSFKVGEQWLSHNGFDVLYLDQQQTGQCAAPLKGAINYNRLLIALCDSELLLLTTGGELLERITPVLGLPADASALALANEQLFINTGSGAIQVDLDSLEFKPANTTPTWITAQQPPTHITTFLARQGAGIDLEQVLLDLHSGRLFGAVGVFVMDVVALLLIVLAVTGIIAWQTGIKMRTKR